VPELSADTVSIAVCTKDRPEQLERLLNSLLRQAPAAHEIIVIDNAPSTERSRRLVAESFPAIRYVREPVSGLDFARNRALREARGTIVAYIDDDAVAAPGWAGATQRVFAESPRIAVCMGKVDAFSLDSEGARLFEATGGFGRGERRIHLPAGAGPRPPGLPRPFVAWSVGVGFGASMAVRRSVALELGGFDEALDMGAVLPGGGDQDILWRVLEAGYEVIYEPRVQAWHEHRTDLEGVGRQIAGHGRALIATLTKFLRVAPWPRKAPVLAFLAWRLIKPLVRLAKRAFGQDPLPAGILWRVLTNSWAGLLAYPAARRMAARRIADVRGQTNSDAAVPGE
jgi:glycosyltransferase involved in cell wall biosynthesis